MALTRTRGRRTAVAVAATGVAVVTVVAGCSDAGSGPSAPSSPASPTAVAAEPGVAPALATPPAGRVVRVGNEPEGLVVDADGNAVVGVRRPDALVLFDAATGTVRKTVPTQGAPRHLALAGPNGPVLAGLEQTNEVVEFLTTDGTIGSRVGNVGETPHDVIRTADGTSVVTNEHGGGVIFLRDGKVVKSLPAGPPQPGGVAPVGDYAVVADVQGNGVWVYDAARTQQVAQRRIGDRLTHVVATDRSMVALADTDGDAVLIERITPQIEDVAAIPVAGKPYGLAYDQKRRRLYVAGSADNRLTVIDLADPTAPKVIGHLPTARQPNSVAVDPKSGSVLVTGSAAGADSAIEIIPPDQLP
ncbi:NHL repeat-containing protein [Williamsia sterculiae]|uniref:DNA-binding beta-propeller fold protein YncE n=1 Tax=Williamsia sterculiae TaxID=1344003 RepID=A0A1N7FT40_9NOCA|nr:hypothetical protein [Williamsia sterculiae]SIS03426.1 hypothetical protein SAMN05445060_2256 [Williamsia sterculiae]